MSDTKDHLHAHHRGPGFVETMIDSFAGRYNDFYWEFVSKALKGTDPRVAVDLGAGPGLMLLELLKRYPTLQKVTGCEVMPYMLDKAKELTSGHSEAALVEINLEADDVLPLPDASVDLITSGVLVHELRQPVSLFREVARVLKPGGVFILLDWVRMPLTDYSKLRAVELPELLAEPPATEELISFFQHYAEHCHFAEEDLLALGIPCGLQPIHWLRPPGKPQFTLMHWTR